MVTKKKSSKANTSKKATKNNATDLKVVGGQEKTAKAATEAIAKSSSKATTSNTNTTTQKTSIKATAKPIPKKPAAKAKETNSQTAKNIDDTNEAIKNAISRSQKQFEDIVNYGNKGTDAGREVSEEIAEYTNKWLDKQIEVSKELMECRTFNDLFELQNRITTENMENIFDESSRISEIIIGFATEASEPFQKNIADATAELSKNFKI